jgi:hypothetical protein
MTAADNPALVAAAAAAIEAGMEQANQCHESAGRSPGQGLQVALPSYPYPHLPPVQGLGFDVPADQPALRPAPKPTLVPDYSAEPIVGGVEHVGRQGVPGHLDGIAWPSARTSSVVVVRASTPCESTLSRLLGAIRRMLGR